MTSSAAALGRYELQGVIGRGGMALVYRGHDRETGARVAVKLLADNLAADPELRRRFAREAELAKRLSHLNVVRVLASGDSDGRAYIVLEYVAGRSLAEELERSGRMAPEQAAQLGAQAAAALAHAHERGVVHRDVKPHNLLLADDGALKVADFGIARVADGTELTQIGTILGTVAYLAPEQAAGEEATGATDVYALGAVLYELLTGRTPYRAASLPELVFRRQDDIPPPSELAPGVPPELDATVLACLHDEPGERPAAGEVERMLRGDAPAPTLVLPRPSEARTVVLRRPRRGRRLLVAGAALLAGLALGLTLAFGGSGGGRAAPHRPAAPAARRVMPVPTAATPAGQAASLSRWLRAQAR